MNFYVSTNYFKIIRLGYYFLLHWQLENFVFLFHSELVTRKFYFYILLRVTNSEILLVLFFRVGSNSEILF